MGRSLHRSDFQGSVTSHTQIWVKLSGFPSFPPHIITFTVRLEWVAQTYNTDFKRCTARELEGWFQVNRLTPN